jgi:6-phosphofructokinase 1
MGSLVVLTSGGDAPGMNAAVRSVARCGAARGWRVLGALDGYDGLVEGRLRELTRTVAGGLSVDPELDVAAGLGGTILGSARSTRFRTVEGRATAADRLRAHDGLIVIGGDGSLTGAHLFAGEHGARVVGIPASIDNDIGCTMGLGVDSALGTIVEACDRISDTARSHRRAFVVEVMGRHSGYLAMASAIAAAADGVLVREQGRSEDEIVAATATLIANAFARDAAKRRVLIVKAEGVDVPCTRLVRRLEERISPVGYEIRATVLGHLVRGGAPSYQDRMIGGRLGLAAVDAVIAGQSDVMVAWTSPVPGGTPTDDPAVRTCPLTKVLSETAALLDGTSTVTKWRVSLMSRVEGVLSI